MGFENTRVLNKDSQERLAGLIRKEFDELSEIHFITGEAQKLIYDAYCLKLDDLVEDMLSDSKSQGYPINLENLIENA